MRRAVKEAQRTEPPWRRDRKLAERWSYYPSRGLRRRRAYYHAQSHIERSRVRCGGVRDIYHPRPQQLR